MTGLLPTSEAAPFKDFVLSSLDPRLKLMMLLSVVVTIFSASGFSVLLWVGLLAIGLLVWQPSVIRLFIRRLAYLRWLLLFTLLLHLFLTPGRTLFGLRMLSYDGLLRGIMVDLQLFLALFFTLCFALFTEPEAVAWGVAKLMKPLQYLGVPVSETGGLLVLVLHFLPQVFQLGDPLLQVGMQPGKRGVDARLRQLSRLVGEAILVLVERADALVQDISRGEIPLIGKSDEFRWKRIDSLSSVLGLLFITLCWSL